MRAELYRVLTGEVLRTAEEIVEKYPNSRSATLPLLFLVQSVEGHVSEQGMREVADFLGLTSAEVLASASFYTMLKQRPQGRYLISVCRNISCTHNGARDVISALEKHLAIEVGATTPDGVFTLEAAECLATCDGAPSMQINYEDFYNVTPEDAVLIAGQLAADMEIRSARGERVPTAKEAARETAMAGVRSLRNRRSEPQHEDTVGGETPRPGGAPGFRPREEGSDG